jgi:hypothetical protein
MEKSENVADRIDDPAVDQRELRNDRLKKPTELSGEGL